MFLREDDTNASVLERVAVNEALSNQLRQRHDLLNLFRRNVLTLRQLEYVLRSIYDLHRTVRVYLYDVTS